MLLILVLASARSIFLSAQSAPLIEHLTINEGLSQGYVSCLVQDADGFIWIGTKNGLNRYDGRQVRVYSHNPFDSSSISNDWVVSLYDHGRFLLVGTNGGGLNVFDKKTGKARRLRIKKDVHGFLSTGSIQQIFCDKYENVWLLVRNAKVGKRLLKIRFVESPKRLDIDQTVFEQLRFGEDFEVIIDKKGAYLWGINKDHVFKLDPQTSRVQLFNWPSDFPAPNTFSIATSNDSLVWVILENYVVKFNGKTWTKTLFPGEDLLHRIIERDGKLILRITSGLYGFDPMAFSRPFLKKGDAKLTLPMERGRPLDVLLDRSGIYWVGTSGYGVMKYNPKKQGFRLYYPGTSVYTPILPDITDIFSLFKKHAPGADLQTPRLTIDLPGSYSRLDAIISDRLGETYLLYRIADNPNLFLAKIDSAATVQTIMSIPTTTHRRSALATAEQGYFWIASGSLLVKARPENQQYQTYRFDTLMNASSNIFEIKSTPDKHLWIATEKGLVEAIPMNSGFNFRLHAVNANNPNSLQNNEVLSMLPDPDRADILWIGTRGGGLNKLDIKSGKFSHLTTENGLPNNVIYGILADEGGALWMSSNQGIIKYNPATRAIQNYTVKDGLPTNEFNTWAYAKQTDGTMLFGCVEGLVVFHPGSFSVNPVVPQVKITGMKVNNQKVEVGDSTGILNVAIEYTQQISLPFYKNNLTLEFAALEYSVPSKNKFKYYLEGQEQAWAHEGLEPKANYLNLSPGKYIFKIKGANNDGVWSDKLTELKIIILPPWYQTTAAYAGYLLLFIALLYGALQFLLNRQNLKHRLEMEQKEAEWLKDSFIANVHSVVEANLEDENFGVQDLCQTLGISRTQLHQKIKTRTGKSTSLYIRSLRLRKARQLLLTTDMNVSEISIQVGFRHIQHFSKFYFEEFGEQPSKTR